MIVLALFLPPHRCPWAHEKEMFRAHSLRSLTREQSLPRDVMPFGAMVGPHSPNLPDLPDRRGVDPPAFTMRRVSPGWIPCGEGFFLLLPRCPPAAIHPRPRTAPHPRHAGARGTPPACRPPGRPSPLL